MIAGDLSYFTAKMFPIGNYYKLFFIFDSASTEIYTHIGDVLFPKLVGCNIKKYSLSGNELQSRAIRIKIKDTWISLHLRLESDYKIELQ